MKCSRCSDCTLVHKFILTSKISARRVGAVLLSVTPDVSAALARRAVCLESEGVYLPADHGGLCAGGVERFHKHSGEILCFWHNAAEAGSAADLKPCVFWINLQ